jgi:phospholipid/cholesterol/gamma-HCH transport system ATP-binding protein
MARRPPPAANPANAAAPAAPPANAPGGNATGKSPPAPTNTTPAASVGADGTILAVEDLHVTFDRQNVLRDIHLKIPRGQTVAIIGESGCGKTVLLKSLIGLVRPAKGRILFDNQDLARLSERQLTRERTRFGFVFQMAALFDSLTVGQNVSFPLREHTKRTHREMQQIVLERLAEVGLPETAIHKKPAELSGGMRKRVGLARALAMDPEVVLYDEPTTGLDPIMSDVINELILRTRQRHPVTSIVVTHDMKSARKVADRIVMLYPLSRLSPDEPQILFDGPPDAIDRSPDRRVIQFVEGEAGERLTEMAVRKEGSY